MVYHLHLLSPRVDLPIVSAGLDSHPAGLSAVSLALTRGAGWGVGLGEGQAG